MDVNAIVSSSVADLHDAAGTTPDMPDTPVEAPEAPVEAVEAAGDTPVTPDTPVAAIEPDDLTKELEAAGIKALTGQRENRIPYSRVKKIIENSRKTLAETHEKALKEREERLTKAEERSKHMDAVDRLINEDADKYMSLLAQVNPKYARFIQQGVVPPVAPKEEYQEPAPGPDATFADGTKGYSAEGLEKLRAWDRQQAIKEATKLFNARLEPIEKDRQAREQRERQQRDADDYRAKQIPVVKNQIAVAQKTWGKLFEDDYNRQHEDKSEILHFLRANPTVPFDAAVAQVLLPKLQANRDTMRSDLLKEINGRPAAAVKAPVPAVLAGDTGGGRRSTEDVIRASIAAMKQ